LRNGLDPDEGQCINISLGGMYVCANSPRPEGSEVEIEFELPPNRRVRATGKVIRTTRRPGEEYPTGMGIMFFELPPEGKEDIDYYVRKTYRVLRALFFELNRARVNDEKIWKLVEQSPIKHKYPLHILKEIVTAELSKLRLRRAGPNIRK